MATRLRVRARVLGCGGVVLIATAADTTAGTATDGVAREHHTRDALRLRVLLRGITRRRHHCGRLAARLGATANAAPALRVPVRRVALCVSVCCACVVVVVA